MRQWLPSCLQQYMCISVPLDTEDASVRHMFLQVLSLERKTCQVKTFHALDDTLPEDAMYDIRAQPVERWRPPFADDACSPGTDAEVYVYRDPEQLDVLALCGGGMDNRSR